MTVLQHSRFKWSDSSSVSQSYAEPCDIWNINLFTYVDCYYWIYYAHTVLLQPMQGKFSYFHHEVELVSSPGQDWLFLWLLLCAVLIGKMLEVFVVCKWHKSVRQCPLLCIGADRSWMSFWITSTKWIMVGCTRSCLVALHPYLQWCRCCYNRYKNKLSIKNKLSFILIRRASS